MTVRLLQPYGKYPKNANLTTAAATEDMLLRTGWADTNTAAGTTYVGPVPTERSGPPAVESTGGVDVLRADGRELLNLSAAQTLVSGGGKATYYSNFQPSNPSTTSNSATIAAAIDDAITQGAQELILPAGDFYLPSLVTRTVPANFRIVGQGGERTRFLTDSTGYMFDFRGGALGSAISVTANVAVGDTQITVSDASAFVARGFANLQSQKIWDATSTKNARYGELVRIKSVVGNTVTFYEPVRYGYLTTDTPTLSPCGMTSRFRLEGIGFINKNPLTGAAGAVVLRNFTDLIVDSVYGELLDGPLLSYVGIFGGESRNVTARYLADDEANNRYGYVHNISDATTGLRILGGSSYACRHHLTTNAGASSTIGGVPVDNQCIGVIARGYTNCAFDTHEEGDSTLIADCQAVGCMDIGFGIRAPRTTLANVVVSGGKGTGIFIRSTALRSEVLNAKVSDLTGLQSARNNPTVGIDVQAAETVVDGFNVNNVGQAGVRILGASREQIRNGRIFGFGTSGTNIIGIHFSGPSLDHEIQDVRIDGNGLGSSAGLLAGTAGNAITGVKISNVVVRRCSNAQQNVPNLTTNTVNGTAVTETVLNSTLV